MDISQQVRVVLKKSSAIGERSFYVLHCIPKEIGSVRRIGAQPMSERSFLPVVWESLGAVAPDDLGDRCRAERGVAGIFALGAESQEKVRAALFRF